MEYTLTVIDARNVQRYLFGANELKQSLGASELVERATHDWVFESLESIGYIHNAKDQRLEEFNGRAIENGLTAEVLYAGGGNTAFLFKSLP